MRCCEYLPHSDVTWDKADGVAEKSGLVASLEPDKEVPLKPTDKPTDKSAKPAKVSKKAPSKYALIPYFDSITVPGSMLVKAGFVPGQEVQIWYGRKRAVISKKFAASSTGRISKRYKAEPGPVATCLSSCSVRIRAIGLAKYLGVEHSGEFKATVLEANAVAIYKA